MKPEFQEQVDGNRHLARAVYRGHSVDIVTGFDIVSDRWPIHIDIDGQRIDGFTMSASSKAEALSEGWRAACAEIDTRWPNV